MIKVEVKMPEPVEPEIVITMPLKVAAALRVIVGNITGSLNIPYSAPLWEQLQKIFPEHIVDSRALFTDESHTKAVDRHVENFKKARRI